jgi:Flp pilus assembly protein TadD
MAAIIAEFGNAPAPQPVEGGTGPIVIVPPVPVTSPRAAVVTTPRASVVPTPKPASGDPPQDPQVMLRKAVDLIVADTPKDAIPLLDEVVKRLPNMPEALAHQGLALYLVGRLAEAEQVYTTMIARFPSLAEPHANLAVVYTETNRPELAEASFRKALAVQPDFIEVRTALADLLLARGWVDAAVLEWKIIADSDPNLSEYRVRIADAYAGAGRHDDAIAAYLVALERGDDPSLRLRLGRALRASGRLASAVEQFRLAALTGPGGPDALVELAECLFELGYKDAARETVRRALAIAPTDSSAVALADRLQDGHTRPGGRGGILTLFRRN